MSAVRGLVANPWRQHRFLAVHAWVYLAWAIVPVLIASLLQAFGLTGTPQEPNALGWICTLVTMGVGIWFLIELGILKGTPGPNRFGGDPLAAVA